MKNPRRKRSNRRFVGIIAEDHSDIAVLTSLISKIARSSVPIRPIVAGGCGKIVGKCRAWAQNLKEQGCRYLLVVHDLDERILNKLRLELTSALNPSPIATHIIVIPVREIEAWLLADHEAINRSMKLKKPLKMVTNPEGIRKPKEHLADLVHIKSNKERRYFYVVDNKKVAEQCVIENLKRCTSFVPFADFIAKHLGAG